MTDSVGHSLFLSKFIYFLQPTVEFVLCLLSKDCWSFLNRELIFIYFCHIGRAYDSFENCVRTYRGYCATLIRVQLEGLEGLYDYLCNEGFESEFSTKQSQLQAWCIGLKTIVMISQKNRTGVFRNQGQSRASC